MYGSLDMSAPRLLLLILCLQTGAALELTVPPTHKATMGSAVQIPFSFKVNRPPVIRKDLQIVWRFQGKDILSVQNTAVTKSDPRLSYVDRAVEGSAGLTITNVTLSDGGMYTCWVRYSADTKEQEVRLDIQATPQMRVTDKAVVTNKPSVLRSSITGFYPEDIDIKWYRDGEILNAVLVGKLLRHPDGTYSVNSSVTITPTEEDRERIFSCRIQHQSLSGPLEEAFKLMYGDVTINHGLIIAVVVLLLCVVSLSITTAVYITRYKKLKVKKEKNGEMKTLLNVSHTEDKATENAAATTEKKKNRESPGVSNTGICIDKSTKPAEHGNEGTEIQGGQQGVKELMQMFERKE